MSSSLTTQIWCLAPPSSPAFARSVQIGTLLCLSATYLLPAECVFRYLDVSHQPSACNLQSTSSFCVMCGRNKKPSWRVCRSWDTYSYVQNTRTIITQLGHLFPRTDLTYNHHAHQPSAFSRARRWHTLTYPSTSRNSYYLGVVCGSGGFYIRSTDVVR